MTQLPLISKLAEQSVQIQLLEHMECHGLIADNHHGYRKNTNTTSAILQIMDMIATNTDSNLITASLSVDQSAAFDNVEHRILLKKLKFYYLGETTMRWLESYLSYRSNYVAIGTADSVIPQGSCLGPLLYLIYVNKFMEVSKDDNCDNRAHMDKSRLFGGNSEECGTMVIFADDGKYLIASNNRAKNQNKIEETFDKIVDYLNANGLAVNNGKTGLTEFMTRQNRVKTQGIPPELTTRELVNGQFKDIHITDNKNCRFFGTHFKNDLKWDDNIEYGKKAILPMVRKQLGALSKLKNTISKKGKLHIVNGLIVSRILYGIGIWGNTSENITKKVQICLNKCVRYVLGCNKYTKEVEMMNECNWLNVSELTEYFSILQLWKVLRWKSPKYLREKFSIEEEEVVRTDVPRLKITREAWRTRTKDRWNKLPYELRTETCISKFKKCLKRHIGQKRGHENTRLAGMYTWMDIDCRPTKELEKETVPTSLVT